MAGVAAPIARTAQLLDAPIGVFDSGIGGLTVLAALMKAPLVERFMYLGDTARLPYGTKTAQTVARYAEQAASAGAARRQVPGRGLQHRCIGGPDARVPRRQRYSVIGVIEPGAQAACAATSSGHIAVIATEATVRGGAYQRAILERRAECQQQLATHRWWRWRRGAGTVRWPGRS